MEKSKLKGKLRTIPKMRKTIDMTQLYAPQFEQFGIKLQERGNIFANEIETNIGRGSAWIMPLTRNCLVMEHAITPAEDMQLLEFTPSAYACMSAVNCSTLECMPKAGISPRNIYRANTAANTAVCTFVNHEIGIEYSPLNAGATYYSKSILFLPEFFEELAKLLPGDYSDLFYSFDYAWDSDAKRLIASALNQLHLSHTATPKSNVYMQTLVQNLVAKLALLQNAEYKATENAASTSSTRLIKKVIAYINSHLSDPEAIKIESLCAEFYVSRTKLCEEFKVSTGESIGNYVRDLRITRAKEMLLDVKQSIAKIAEALGYPSQAAFTQSFKQATGLTPSAWRSQN